MAGAERSEGARLPGGYPPDVHLLRDLRLWIERDAAGARAGLELVPELRNDRGQVRAGVLAALVDAAGGECGVRAARPSWVATSDLVLHVTRPVGEGTVVAAPEVLRKTRSTVVIEVVLREGDAGGERFGFATMTFAVLAARSEVQRMGTGFDEPRTEFARGGSKLAGPVLEQIGARVVDPEAGAVELPMSSYVGNSLGGLQGGVVCMLVDLSAQARARALTGEPCVSTDLAVNFLALGRVGPIRSRAEVLRREPGGALVRVELRDAGQEDRLMTVATVNAVTT